MASLSTNTHFYDGKLKELVKHLDGDAPVDFDETIADIAQDSEDLEHPYINNVTKCLELFKRDKTGNKDNANNITVENLLPIVWDNVKKNYDDSGKIIFYEQLSDIVTSGPCAQGRTTRLIQFLE